MKKIQFTLILVLIAFWSFSQEMEKPYSATKDANKQISDAVAQATKENKHIILQIGGNWCPWCLKLNNFVKTDNQIDSLMKANFVYVHINYSKENKNMDVMKKLEYPQRFGFPVLVVLDGTGRRLNTQNSSYLEQDKGYSKEKVLDFLKSWTPAALKPETYTEK